MGAHYGAILVKAEQPALLYPVLEILASKYNRKFLVGPSVKGWVSIFPSEHGHDDRISAEIAKRMFGNIFHLLVYHDDIFVYYFYRDGQLLDKYNSNPDYFEDQPPEEKESLRGRPEVFCDLLPVSKNLNEIKFLLDTTGNRIVFEQQRMEQFIYLVGLPNVLSSYEYLQEGERGGIKGWKQFIHIPDLTAEKEAKKQAAAALRHKKKLLTQEGLLVAECVPDAAARRRVVIDLEFHFDPIERGLLVSWLNNDLARKMTQLTCIRPPWKAKPEPIGPDFCSLGQATFKISGNGKWLVFSDGKLRIWNWQKRELLPDFQFDRSDVWPIGFSNDEEHLLCKSAEGFFRISMETRRIESPIPTSPSHPCFQAADPSMNYLVFGSAQGQVAIMDLNAQEVKSVLFYGAKSSPYDQLKAVGLPVEGIEAWRGFIQGSGNIFRAKFSPDGSLFFCGASDGIRVFDWNDLLCASETTPDPKFALTPGPSAFLQGPNEGHYVNYIYDVVFDDLTKRLLGCGIDGRIHYLGLNDGRSGVLLEPIEKCGVSRMELSSDRQFVCLMCTPHFGEKDRKFHRLQVWNYPALCRKAGLE
jgi:hypothetical protein